MKAVIYTTKKGYTEKNPEKWIKKRIRKIASKHPDLQLDYKIEKGDAVVSMQSVAKNIGADLLISGCQGARENNSIFLGSTAGGIMMTSKIPVILIPPRFKYTGITNVIIAALYSQVSNPVTLKPLQTLVDSHQSDVQLLLFGESPDEPQPGKASLLPLVNDVHHYKDEHHTANLHSYLEKHPTDLLTVIRRKKGFLERTIGPKRTTSTRFHASIPVLVLIGENG